MRGPQRSTWLRSPIIRGWLELKGARLVLSTHSRERADKGCKRLERIAGDAVRAGLRIVDDEMKASHAAGSPPEVAVNWGNLIATPWAANFGACGAAGVECDLAASEFFNRYAGLSFKCLISQMLAGPAGSVSYRVVPSGGAGLRQHGGNTSWWAMTAKVATGMTFGPQSPAVHSPGSRLLPGPRTGT